MSNFASSDRIAILLQRLSRANAVVARCTNELLALVHDPYRVASASRIDNLAGSRFVMDDGQSPPIIDTAAMSVTWHGRTCALGNTLLFQLMERLARRPNHFISFDRLVRDVWNGNIRSDETIRSAIRNLKRQLVAAGMADLGTAIRAQRRHYVLSL